MHLPDLPCYLNGEFMPLPEARISPMDRGFLFGDGLYEAMPVYGRRIFRFDAHMDRLEHGLAKLRIESPLGRADWLALARRLIEQGATENQLVYLQVTRGVAPAPTPCQPTSSPPSSPTPARYPACPRPSAMRAPPA